MKKIVSLLLAMILVIGLLPLAAFAAECEHANIVEDHTRIQVRVPAKCMTEGSYKPAKKCADCGKEFNAYFNTLYPIEKKGHTMPTEANYSKVEVAATCAKAGRIAHFFHCVECDKLLTKRYERPAATGVHNFTDVEKVEVVNEATCCECGLKKVTYGCTGCTATYTVREAVLPNGNCPDENGNGICDLWD